jgi:hypothetical protein
MAQVRTKCPAAQRIIAASPYFTLGSKTDLARVSFVRLRPIFASDEKDVCKEKEKPAEECMPDWITGSPGVALSMSG